jgi:2-polyprenyl-6-methoxyphenol hydroxylase-like FAD-dependent oxidoreductase
MPRVAPLRIAVVGAGLGGLTAAVALRQAGFDIVPNHIRCHPSSREEGIPMKLSFGLRLRCTVLSR